MVKTILISTILSVGLFSNSVSSVEKDLNSGEELYKKCVACHGIQAEKKALGKSNVVSDMSEDEIINSLKGYKNGTYGGAMKGIMLGQVKNLDDTDIITLAKYIKQLNLKEIEIKE